MTGFLFSACGYQLERVQPLPSQLPCVKVVRVENPSAWPGLEGPLQRALEDELVRRQQLCGRRQSAAGGELKARLARLEVRPFGSDASGGAVAITGELEIHLALWKGGQVVGSSQYRSLSILSVTATEEGVGAAREAALRRSWEQEVPDAARVLLDGLQKGDGVGSKESAPQGALEGGDRGSREDESGRSAL